MQRRAALERFRPELEAELQKHVSPGRSPLYDMLRYHLGWIDERRMPAPHARHDRVHGALCLLVAETVGADYHRALPAAVAVELADGFARIHEDLRVGSPARDNRPAVWWVWGHAQGINAGDGMYALARLAVLKLEQAGLPAEATLRATATLDRYCLELCEHQFLDIETEGQPEMSVQGYLPIAQGTNGALMGCAAELGALAGAAAKQAIEAFALFGRKIGVAYRIRRDIDALWDRTSAGRSRVVEILDMRRSLPLLYALETLRGIDRDLLDALARRERPIEDSAIDQLLDVLRRAGARRLAEEAMQSHLTEALEALSASGASAGALEPLKALAHDLARPEA